MPVRTPFELDNSNIGVLSDVPNDIELFKLQEVFRMIERHVVEHTDKNVSLYICTGRSPSNVPFKGISFTWDPNLRVVGSFRCKSCQYGHSIDLGLLFPNVNLSPYIGMCINFTQLINRAYVG